MQPCRRHAQRRALVRLTALPLIELHPMPASQTRIIGYPIAEAASGGGSYFTTRQVRQSRLWVFRVGGNRGDLPTSVRSTSDGDRKFNALAYVARC
jgi:hypothetical protein